MIGGVWNSSSTYTFTYADDSREHRRREVNVEPLKNEMGVTACEENGIADHNVSKRLMMSTASKAPRSAHKQLAACQT